MVLLVVKSDVYPQEAPRLDKDPGVQREGDRQGDGGVRQNHLDGVPELEIANTKFITSLFIYKKLQLTIKISII